MPVQVIEVVHVNKAEVVAHQECFNFLALTIVLVLILLGGCNIFGVEEFDVL